MNLPLSEKVVLLAKLGNYIRSENSEWKAVKEKATLQNSWFISEFVDAATRAIAEAFLQEERLREWVSRYDLSESAQSSKPVGIVMAGNLPAVGFHDLLCGFLSNHPIAMKLSSKDQVLLPHFVDKLRAWEPAIGEQLSIAERLNGCAAYIATGSNNSARYFQQYFGKYPHIIRRNRTAVAVLNGEETREDLELLADDMLMYFGRGCRNVTKIFVPEGYDFVPLLEAMQKYAYLKDVYHYKNNFDYQLSLLLLNQAYYMTNDLVLLHPHESVFSPVSVVHYAFYSDRQQLEQSLGNNDDLQCIVGQGHTGFGSAQRPRLEDYADGVDTLAFLAAL